MNNLNQIKEAAVKGAQEAGEILLQHFKHVKLSEIHGKEVDGKVSPVTDWDIKANEIINRYIKEYFPDHDILSEEAPFEDNPSNWVWVIDPLDGTWNYINNKAFWGVSIAVFEGMEPRVGVVSVPTEGDLYTAVHNQGAFRNGQRLSVSPDTKLAGSVVTVGKGHENEAKAFSRNAFESLKPLTCEAHTRGASAVELIRVASGDQTGTVMAGIKVWDVAGGIILVREAGGRVTDFTGSDWNLKSKDVLASNGHVHEAVLKAITA